MRKIPKLTRNELVEQIRKSISKNLYEQDYSADLERATQPREFQVKDIFGPTYSRYIPNDVIRYMRKNPAAIFQRLFDIYGEEAFTYLEKAKEKRGGSSSMEEPMMEQTDIKDLSIPKQYQGLAKDYVKEKIKDQIQKGFENPINE